MEVIEVLHKFRFFFQDIQNCFVKLQKTFKEKTLTAYRQQFLTIFDLNKLSKNVGQYEKSLRYPTIACSELPPDSSEVFGIYQNIGAAYYKVSKYELALKYLQKYLDHRLKNTSAADLSLKGIYADIATIYTEMNMLDEGLKYCDMVISMQSGELKDSTDGDLMRYFIAQALCFERKFTSKLALESNFKALEIALRIYSKNSQHLGALHNNIASCYLSLQAVAWDNENHLTFNVPFDNIKPTIHLGKIQNLFSFNQSLFSTFHLDIFLPRIVDLALHSSDRQTKITACELLQSIMLYMIGKSANNRSNAAASYEKLYARLFPVVLELSCDSDTVDGMTSGRNASIRDFRDVCLKKFLKWAVKHAGGFDKSAYVKNATSILKRIISFSMHPNSFKRLRSTLAWNSIYTLYRESETLIDVYTLQLLYVFVESLAIAQGDDPSLGTQRQAIETLSHVQRIIKEKSQVFIKETSKQHRPSSWTDATFDVAVRWLLRQCGRIETESRRKYIELACTFIPLLSGIRSIREYFELKVKSDGNVYFIELFEGTLSKEKKRKFKANLANQTCFTNMSEQFSVPMVYQWLDTVIALLDCYTWTKNQQSRVIVVLSYFITKISMNTLYDIITYFPPSNQTNVFTPTDISQFETAKCTVIVRLLNFITALWSKYPQDAMRAIDSSFYNNDLTKLILTCDEYIFENLIDPDYKYTFPLELERYYAKDKHNPLHQQRPSSTPRYLSSQYLFGSSLTDELAVFDFISAAVNQQHNDLNKSLSNSLSDNSSTNIINQKKMMMIDQH
ncbi:unnamed protein product [Rotaria sp. Silwood2]|nr:unnamed protein product [Rotaria sp. Silwood2]